MWFSCENNFFKSLLTLTFCLLLETSNIYCDEEPSHSIQLTTIDFNTEISSNNYFVMFYAPWCTFCTKLKPIWEELAEMLNEPDSRVKIAQVDCTTESGICKQQEITGFPTLLYYKKGESEPVKYSGTRDLSSLANFLNDQLSSNRYEESGDVLETPGPVELTDESYKDHLAKGRHFVKFYAPWCGHCQILAPTWEKLGMLFAPYESVTIGKIDCTIHKEACQIYDVRSYPTLLWIENGVKLEKYGGARSLEELESFVTEKLSAGREEEVAEEGAKAGKEEEELEAGAGPVAPVTHLTGDNFHEAISEGITFVEFFAPWCGYCKSLAATWQLLGEKYSTSSQQVTIADVDCMAEANKKLCNQQEVNGYPTIILYKNGERVEKYTGGRSLEDLVAFLDDHQSSSSSTTDEQTSQHDEL